jgi:hypothetical protein
MVVWIFSVKEILTFEKFPSSSILKTISYIVVYF